MAHIPRHLLYKRRWTLADLADLAGSDSSSSSGPSFGSANAYGKRDSAGGLTWQQALRMRDFDKYAPDKEPTLGAQLKGGVGTALGGTLKVITSPLMGVAGAVDELWESADKGENPIRGLAEGAKGFATGLTWQRDAKTFGDVLRKHGVGGEDFKTGAVGFGLDVALDPTTYLFGVGLVSKAAKADDVYKLGRTAIEGAEDVKGADRISHFQTAAKGMREAPEAEKFNARATLAEARAEREAMEQAGKFEPSAFNDRADLAERARLDADEKITMLEAVARHEDALYTPRYMSVGLGIPFTGKQVNLVQTGIKTPSLVRRAEQGGMLGKAALATGRVFNEGFAPDTYKAGQGSLAPYQTMHEAERVRRRIAHTRAADHVGVAQQRLGRWIDKDEDWQLNALHPFEKAGLKNGEVDVDYLRKAGLDDEQIEFVKDYHEVGRYFKMRDATSGRAYKTPLGVKQGYVPHPMTKDDLPLELSNVALGGINRKVGYTESRRWADASLREIVDAVRKENPALAETIWTKPIDGMMARARRGGLAQADQMMIDTIKRVHGKPLKIADEAAQAEIRAARGPLEKELDDALMRLDPEDIAAQHRTVASRFHNEAAEKITREAAKAAGAVQSALRRIVPEGQGVSQADLVDGPPFVGQHTYEVADEAVAPVQGQAAREELMDPPQLKQAQRRREEALDDLSKRRKVEEDKAGVTTWKQELADVSAKIERVTAEEARRSTMAASARQRAREGKAIKQNTRNAKIHDGKRLAAQNARKRLEKQQRSLRGKVSYHSRAINRWESVERGKIASRYNKLVRGLYESESKTAIENLRLTRSRAADVSPALADVLATAERLAPQLTAAERRAVKSALDRFNREMRDAMAKAGKQTTSELDKLAKEQDRLAARAARIEGDELPRLEQRAESAFKDNPDVDGLVDFEGAAVLPEIAAAMTRVRKLADDDKALADFKKGYEKFMSTWKKVVTSLNPSYHARNAMTDYWNMYVAGVPTWAMAKYTWEAAKLIDNAERATGKLVRGESVTAEERAALAEFERATQHGVTSGFFGQDIQQQIAVARYQGRYAAAAKSGAITSKVGVPSLWKMYSQFMQDLGRERENMGRMAHYLYRRQHEKLSPADAAAHVMSAHFDYDDLSRFDRGIRQVIPFWTWTRKNIPYQVQQIMKRPGKVSTFPKFVMEMEGAAGGTEGELVPDFFSDNLSFKVPFGEHTYVAPQIGLLDLEKVDAALQGDPRSFLSGVNPVAKAAFELTTGQNLAFGGPIEGPHPRNPVRTKFGPVDISGVLEHLPGANFGPTAREAFGDQVQGPGISPFYSYLFRQTPQTNLLFNQTSDIRAAQRGIPFGAELGGIGGFPIYGVDQQQQAKIEDMKINDAFSKHLKGLRDAGEVPAAEAENPTYFDYIYQNRSRRHAGRQS